MKTLHLALLAGGGLLLASRARASTTTGGGAGASTSGSGGASGGGSTTKPATTIGDLFAGITTALKTGLESIFQPSPTTATAPTADYPQYAGDPLASAYLAGDFSTLNSLLASGGITAGVAAERYGLPDSSLITMRESGVVFAADSVTSAASSSGTTNWTPIYQAYETSDYGALNAQLSAQGVTADEAAAQYGLSDAMLQQMQANGIVFATA